MKKTIKPKKQVEIIEDDFGTPNECIKCLEAKDVISKLLSLLANQSGKSIEKAKDFIK